MSSTLKRFCPGLNESVYPGSEGATTVKCSVSSGISLWNSNTEPGQPCEISSGIGFGPRPGSWMKCRSMPPTVAVYCRKPLSFASHVRQSNSFCQ